VKNFNRDYIAKDRNLVIGMYHSFLDKGFHILSDGITNIRILVYQDKQVMKYYDDCLDLDQFINACNKHIIELRKYKWNRL